MKSIGAVILGGTGYGAAELLRLFLSHPEVSVVSVVSSSQAGSPIAGTHSHLLGFTAESFVAAPDFERLAAYAQQIIFSSLPHGTSSQAIEKILSAHPKARVIDLSGDLRLRSEARHAQFYGDVPFNVKLRGRFVYGLPEVNREKIRNASCIANPGCLSTASALAALPLVKGGFVSSVVFDAKTGASGAGKTPQASMHLPTRHGNFEAYKVLAHRHEAEIVETLAGVSGKEPATMFVPHLLPTSRGIFVTAYMTLNNSVKNVHRLFEEFYRGHPFIRFRDNTPTLQDVIGTNFCDIAVKVRGEQVVVMTALDNLVKGMAGQAIQNMNLMCGLDETLGLRVPSLGTV